MNAVIVILLLLLFITCCVVLFEHRRRRLGMHMSAEDKALVHVKWHQIEQQIKKGGPTNFRQAIVDADKLVDYCLKQQGVHGDTMGERLRSAQGKFSDYDGIWYAHKVRNQVVHEMDKEVLSFEMKKIIAQFRRALTDLGVL